MRSAVDGRPLRVAVLTGCYSSTQDAQVSALREHTGAEVEVVYRRAASDAPYADEGFASLEGALAWDGAIPAAEVEERVNRFRPDVLYVTSWNHGVYLKVARARRGRALRVMMMDNQWHGTTKQWAGLVASRLFIKPAIDVVFLPNDRHRRFARKLGFPDRSIWYGVDGCDQPRFERPVDASPERPARFLFVGRLVEEKGIDVLLRSYAAYRAVAPQPWPLTLVGTGPLADLAANAEGVELLGFQQPEALPAVYASAGCFVLPSVFEPWGTVIHEAAASGLPVICTTACGAWLDLVRDGYNGFVVPAGDPQFLTEAMTSIAAMNASSLAVMGDASVHLSRQLTPAGWAAYFDERSRAWLSRARPA